MMGSLTQNDTLIFETLLKTSPGEAAGEQRKFPNWLWLNNKMFIYIYSTVQKIGFSKIFKMFLLCSQGCNLF